MQIRMDMEDVTVSLGNNGVVLRIADNAGKHVGKLRVGQATAEWCPGKTRMGNGIKMPASRMIALLEEQS